jgi:hypothetical protein
MFIELYADCTGSPVDSAIRGAAALAYDDPAQLTDLVMWAVCPWRTWPPWW